VSIRELRNRGGEVMERVARGERLLVTRDGHAVAELRPLGRPAAAAGVLVERWSRDSRESTSKDCAPTSTKLSILGYDGPVSTRGFSTRPLSSSWAYWLSLTFRTSR